MVEDMRRGTALLIGIGLVLIGLLTGVLAMLVVQPAELPLFVSRPDTVRLGGGPRVQPPVFPDTAQATSVSQLVALNDLFRHVANQVTPTVVFMQVQTETSQDQLQRFDGELRDRFFRNPVPQRSLGSGVLVSEQGYIVTNNHVVEDAAQITVTLANKRQYDARVIGRDPSTDLAVVKIDAPDPVPAIAFGNSDSVNVGEWVIAVGNPFRLTSTVTAGIVSALGRQVNIIEDTFRIENFIQTDAAINPGNSGGALVNLQGELIGINTAIATESGSYEGYGFAIPSNLMQRVIRDLIEYGEVRRGYLGITIEPVNDERAQALGLDRIRGVYVNNVHPNGAAYRGGLRDGDVVLAVNGRPVNAQNELQSAVARSRPGDAVTLTVWRDDTTRSFTVRLMNRTEWLGELPAAPPQDLGSTEPRPPDTAKPKLRSLKAWGLGVRALTAQEERAFEVEGGVFVAYVEGGSVAEDAGLPRGVVITDINGESVDTVEEAARALAPERQDEPYVLLRVKRRNGTVAFYEMPVPEQQSVPQP